jgi:hypothetical protein
MTGCVGNSFRASCEDLRSFLDSLGWNKSMNHMSSTISDLVIAFAGPTVQGFFFFFETLLGTFKLFSFSDLMQMGVTYLGAYFDPSSLQKAMNMFQLCRCLLEEKKFIDFESPRVASHVSEPFLFVIPSNRVENPVQFLVMDTIRGLVYASMFWILRRAFYLGHYTSVLNRTQQEMAFLSKHVLLPLIDTSSSFSFLGYTDGWFSFETIQNIFLRSFLNKDSTASSHFRQDMSLTTTFNSAAALMRFYCNPPLPPSLKDDYLNCRYHEVKSQLRKNNDQQIFKLSLSSPFLYYCFTSPFYCLSSPPLEIGADRALTLNPNFAFANYLRAVQLDREFGIIDDDDDDTSSSSATAKLCIDMQVSTGSNKRDYNKRVQHVTKWLLFHYERASSLGKDPLSTWRLLCLELKQVAKTKNLTELVTVVEKLVLLQKQLQNYKTSFSFICSYPYRTSSRVCRVTSLIVQIQFLLLELSCHRFHQNGIPKKIQKYWHSIWTSQLQLKIEQHPCSWLVEALLLFSRFCLPSFVLEKQHLELLAKVWTKTLSLSSSAAAISSPLSYIPWYGVYEMDWTEWFHRVVCCTYVLQVRFYLLLKDYRKVLQLTKEAEQQCLTKPSSSFLTASSQRFIYSVSSTSTNRSQDESQLRKDRRIFPITYSRWVNWNAEITLEMETEVKAILFRHALSAFRLQDLSELKSIFPRLENDTFVYSPFLTGIILCHCHQWEKAVAVFEKCKKTLPDFVDIANLYLAKIYTCQSNFYLRKVFPTTTSVCTLKQPFFPFFFQLTPNDPFLLLEEEKKTTDTTPNVLQLLTSFSSSFTFEPFLDLDPSSPFSCSYGDASVEPSSSFSSSSKRARDDGTDDEEKTRVKKRQKTQS